MQIVTILVLAMLCTLAATVARNTTPDAKAVSPQGNFVILCSPGHTAQVDPIVNPGGRSEHMHQFFGNTSTGASSTLKTLQGNGTTCQNKGDTTAYWLPTLSVNGQTVKPFIARAYYRARQTVNRQDIQPYPAGLKMVAGNGRLPHPPSVDPFEWGCAPAGGVRESTTVPMCPSGSRLRLGIQFPDCSNGMTDSPDHISHMRYSSGMGCPSSHPIEVPALELYVEWPTRGGSGIRLSSGTPGGSGSTAHADFFNSWNQGVLADLVSRCLNAGRLCGSV